MFYLGYIIFQYAVCINMPLIQTGTITHPPPQIYMYDKIFILPFNECAVLGGDIKLKHFFLCINHHIYLS